MIWWMSAFSHEESISPWVRKWLRGSLLDRAVMLAPYAFLYWFPVIVLTWLTSSGVVFLLLAWVPFGFLLLDALVDHFYTQAEIEQLTKGDKAILATRAEYLGGHPALPHGRFVYLAIGGHRSNPSLRIILPGKPKGDEDLRIDGGPSEAEKHTFEIPLLDVNKAASTRTSESSLSGELLASLSERPGKSASTEHLTLTVDYQGSSGRKHKVEFTNFCRGNDEIRNWRNHLVCAQVEADTGEVPYGPWISLPNPPDQETSKSTSKGDAVHSANSLKPVQSGNGPAAASLLQSTEEVTVDDVAGNGNAERPARRAFQRR
jgi:hypothetical protein